MDVHPSKHNGSYAKLQECVEELQREGYDGYKVKTLAQIRQTTIDFPQARRHDGITFWLHHDAGNPDVLDAVVRQARSKRVTALYVRSPGPVPGTHQPRIHERGTPRSQAAWRCAGEAAGCARRAYPPCTAHRARRAPVRAFASLRLVHRSMRARPATQRCKSSDFASHFGPVSVT